MTDDARTPRTSPVDVLAIGETMVMVTPRYGGGISADNTFVLRPGGAESNVAALMARLGHTTAWAGAVGDDPFGDLITDALRDQGVDVTLVRRDPRRPTAVYFKHPTADGTEVYYYRTGSAASATHPGDLPAWRTRPARVTHLSGITAALSAPSLALVRRLVADRALGPSTVSFDVNHRPVLWGPGGGAAELLDLARHADIVFTGRDEAQALWGTADARAIRALIPEPAHLIVKDAAVEAVAFTPDGEFRAPARKVEVVDAVGAGDAFAAGWLSGLLDGRDQDTRLRLGHYAASQVLRSPSDHADLPLARHAVELLENGPPHTGTPPVPPIEGQATHVADRRARH
ncbi:sugar kinase [Streptomyces paludis]|uniref:Sugar kinase n=1 Tax=Streptomyces paludis TaxID=2282738 RepID=A0A345HXT2_9ACTN|nr:sugar kinase [Streptomyces paludis]AXG81506.1 sugar kinase [Streptomyces paludis]